MHQTLSFVKRFFAMRWPEYGPAWDTWRCLTPEMRSRIAATARAGEEYPDEWARKVAVGWASPMVRPTFLASWARTVLPVIVASPAGVVIVISLQHDWSSLWLVAATAVAIPLPWLSAQLFLRRRLARKILAANRVGAQVRSA